MKFEGLFNHRECEYELLLKYGMWGYSLFLSDFLIIWRFLQCHITQIASERIFSVLGALLVMCFMYKISHLTHSYVVLIELALNNTVMRTIL
jgi:hypothetical protein